MTFEKGVQYSGLLGGAARALALSKLHIIGNKCINTVEEGRLGPREGFYLSFKSCFVVFYMIQRRTYLPTTFDISRPPVFHTYVILRPKSAV